MSERRHFAVLLCSHNGAPFIEAQLESLRKQTRAPDQVAIHDWGSSDDTRQRVGSWVDNNGLQSCYELSVHDEAPGVCASFLRSLEDLLQRSPTITHVLFCDQDDLWFPEKLAVYDELLASDPGNLQLLYSDAQLMDADGRTSAGYLLPPPRIAAALTIDGQQPGHRTGESRHRYDLLPRQTPGRIAGTKPWRTVADA